MPITPTLFSTAAEPGNAKDSGEFESGNGHSEIIPFTSNVSGSNKVSCFEKRIRDALAGKASKDLIILPAESVALFRLDLPVKGTTRRLAALPFALEEQIAQPLESVAVSMAPPDADFSPNSVLASVVDQSQLAGVDGQHLVLSELMAVPRPPLGNIEGQASWSVWRTGERSLVRQDDGTGFAVRSDMLRHFWHKAGTPNLYSFGEALPAGIPATDLSADLQTPDPADLAFNLLPQTSLMTDNWTRCLRKTVFIVAGAAIFHLGIAFADVYALKNIATLEREKARKSLQKAMPGLTIDLPVAAILSRLSRAKQPGTPDRFLPLFVSAADAVVSANSSVSLQSLQFNSRTNTITMVVKAENLKALQSVENDLSRASINVLSGVAIANQGGAQVELQITVSATQQQKYPERAKGKGDFRK